MPRCIFTGGKHTAFELMMQQVPRGYNPSVETEEQCKTNLESEKKYPRHEKQAIKINDVRMSQKPHKIL
jgi:hypothetical protein